MTSGLTTAMVTCGRQRYASRLEARVALARIWRKQPRRRAGRDERASYWCPFCAGWHLTVQPQRRQPKRRRAA